MHPELQSLNCKLKGFLSRNMAAYCSVILLAVCLVSVCVISSGSPALRRPSKRFVAAAPTLRQVQTVFRHGDRAPLATYPKDKYNITLWPNGALELTSRGKQQSYEYGQFLRSRYANFMGEAYSTSELYIRSSDVDRTLMTAQIVAAGAFPPIPRDIWNPDIRWSPVPVHTVPFLTDTAFVPVFACPRYVRLITNEKVLRTREFVPLYKYLSNHTGNNVSTALQIHYLHDILKAERLAGAVLPEWSKTVYPEPLETLAAGVLADSAGETITKRLGCGGVLKDMVEAINNQASSRNATKTIFYSGHDFTVVCILSTLNLYDRRPVNYLGAAILELHEIKPNKFAIKVLARNSQDSEPMELTMPNCTTLCPLEKFNKLMKPYIPLNPIEECK